MIDKAHLQDKQVLFRLVDPGGVYAGVVRKVENDGFWIETPALVGEMRHDSLWRPLVEKFAGEPVLFVPTASLLYLIAAKE
jgi:hypothetical protein